MRRTSLVSLAAALLLLVVADPAHPAAPADGAQVLVLDHGRVHVRHDRFLGPPDPFRPTAADNAAAARSAPLPTGAPPVAQAASRITVASALKGMLARGGIDADAYAGYRKNYTDALATLKKLSGRRYTELSAVLANLSAVAASGKLTSGRAPLAFLTLERNRQWWLSGRLLAYGERVSFGKSLMVWESYPGQGIQVQWLGTFGLANGMASGKKLTPEQASRTQLKALLDEITPLAVPRAGGIAWEYWFRFDGGSPPWVSGLAQGTAIQTYTRAANRLGDNAYMQVAKSALGIFRTPPPTGVRVKTPAGAHYLIYSFAPGARVLNGFVQALNGLHDYAQASQDSGAEKLFLEGAAEAKLEVPKYDTGAWSLYQLGGAESDLGYHTLLRDFLRNLCTRLTDDEKTATKARSSRDAGNGGSTPSPTVFCTAADHFTTYLKQPPAVSVTALGGARVGTPAALRISLSKVSNATITVRRAGAAIYTKTIQLSRGAHTVTWGPPIKASAVDVDVRAVDLAGNTGSADTTQTVAKKQK